MQPSAGRSRYAAWPLLLALAILFAGLAVVGAQAWRHGAFAYPADDTYIHMAIARNLAQNGTWGVNAGQFAAASSSPLWTLLVAGCFKVCGIHTSIPFILAVICSIALLILIDTVGKLEGWVPWVRAAVLVLVIVIMPLLPVCVLGMEHVLHALLTIFVFYLLWLLPAPRVKVSMGYVLLLLSAMAFCTGARFEGLFLAMAVAFVLLLDGRWLLAIAVVAASFIPVVLMGIECVRNGWEWIPASVRLKGNFQSQPGLLGHITGTIGQIIQNYRGLFPHVTTAFIVPFFVLLILPQRFIDRRSIRVLAVFLLMMGQHIAFAITGSFFRYEAYVMATEVFVVGLVVGPALSAGGFSFVSPLRTVHGLAAVALAGVLALPQVGRGFYGMAVTPIAMKNIHDQQVQMAKFISKFYAGSTIGANDIGAISFSGTSKVIDLYGLSDKRVFEAKVAGDYTTRTIQDYSAQQNMSIAMVYDSWFQGTRALPSNWQRVGFLQIEKNHVCAGGTVSFYAVAPDSAPKLARDMEQFASMVPADVHVWVDPRQTASVNSPILPN